MKTFEFVDDVRYGEEWIEKLYRLRNIAGSAGLVLGLAFAAVAVIIIGATIRMAVLARARRSRSCGSSARPTRSSAGRS